MEKTNAEGANAEINSIMIDPTVSLRERVVNQKIELSGGIRGGDLFKLDAALGGEKDRYLVEVNLGKGRLHLRAGEYEPGVIGNKPKYGNELAQGERGLTPTELFSMLKDNWFGGLRGVFIPGLRKGELLFLDLEDPGSRKLERCPLSDVPNNATAKDYAFPTVKVPISAK